MHPLAGDDMIGKMSQKSADQLDAPEKKSPRLVGLVASAYALITLLMTWPAVIKMSQQLIGNNIDNWVFYWNDWHLRQAISSGLEWFHTTSIFYPEGTQLITHSNSFLNSFLAFVLEPIWGPVAAHNLLFLGGLWLGAVGMFLLALDITQKPSAAFLSGLIFAFAPYHLTQALAHVNLGSIHWWPFYALAVRRIAIQPRLRDAVWLGILAALNLWTSLHLAVLLTLWTAVYLTLFFLINRHALAQQNRLPNIMTHLIVGTIIGLVLSGPVLFPLLRDGSDLFKSATEFEEGFQQQTDLLAYLVPPTYNPLWGDKFVSTYEKFTANQAFMPYIGFITLGLAIIGVIRYRAKSKIWWLSGGLWIVLAAGSALRMNGVVYGRVPLPYQWLSEWFPFSAIRSPDRFNLLLFLSIPLLAGLGAAQIVEKPQRRWWLIPIGLMIVGEYLAVPLPAWELPPDSPFIAQMAQDADQYAIVDYPMGYTSAKRWLYYQTIHGKPTIEGHLSRYTADTYATIFSNPLLSVLYSEVDLPPRLAGVAYPNTNLTLMELGPIIRDMQALNVRYLLHHKNFSDEVSTEQLHSRLPLAPIYQDETLAVYDFRNPLPWQFGDPSTRLNNKIDLITANMNLDEKLNTLEVTLLFQLTAIDTQPLQCELFANEIVLTSLTLFPGDSNWQAGDLSFLTSSLKIERVPNGRYKLHIQCHDDSSLTLSDSLIIFPDQPPLLARNTPDLIFNDQIKLMGYRWQTKTDELLVTFRWLSMMNLETDYKLFVHLQDNAGAIVRQYDAMPCNWQCPTSLWRSGQSIDDEAKIPLWGLPPGDYRLAIGLYNSIDGQRLPVKNEAGSVFPDGYFSLKEPITIVKNN